MIVRGAVPKEVLHTSCMSSDILVNSSAQEALGWKQSIKDYVAENRDRVTGQFIVPISHTIATLIAVRSLPPQAADIL